MLDIRRRILRLRRELSQANAVVETLKTRRALDQVATTVGESLDHFVERYQLFLAVSTSTKMPSSAYPWVTFAWWYPLLKSTATGLSFLDLIRRVMPA